MKEISESEFTDIMMKVEGYIRKKRDILYDQKHVYNQLDYYLNLLGNVVIEENPNE